MERKPNNLISETSVYLQQHAYNPVNWYPWSDEAMVRARSENKLLLVSIGYSSCHWCHVMEHESFENDKVADVMNENFICIKVDREERPDIDNIYMTAVQLMSGSGGWPLNCIALPDGRPVWGGTYFRPERWIEVITGIARYYQSNSSEVVKYAEELSHGITNASLALQVPSGSYTLSDLKPSVSRMKDSFDTVSGGTRGAPKFAMPVNLDFLLHYGYVFRDREVLDHIDFTLLRMSSGGIYDQIGGGFARYSVDEKWRVPHFEKMLYDNAQMVGLYSDAWLVSGNTRFRDVVYQTVGFLEREMVTAEGLLSGSIDADSEGEEGRFYVWTPAELETVDIEERNLFERYFGIDVSILWEGKYHILTSPDDEMLFCDRQSVEYSELQRLKELWRRQLLEVRSKRVRPVTDTKVITAWNAMAITGLIKAYRAFGDKQFLSLAEKIAEKLVEVQMSEDFELLRIYQAGNRSQKGFLDDYAFLIQALISLYEVTMESRRLALADDLVRYVIANYYDPDIGMFLYSRKGDNVLITNHFEIYDNVVPSSNSVMAQNLFRLGNLLGETFYTDMAASMLEKISDKVTRFPLGYAGWARLMLWINQPFYQIAVAGEDAVGRLMEILSHYIPGSVIAGTVDPDNNTPLFRNRFVKDRTLIYLCVNNSCELPVEKVDDLLKRLTVS